MWYRASKFSSMEKARSVWQQLKQALVSANFNGTPVSMLVKGVPHVVLVADKQPTPSIESTIMRYIEHGIATSLPDEAIQTIWQRRMERQAHASPLAGTSGYAYEGHTPTSLDWHDKADTPEQARENMRATVKELERQGYPFISIYSLYLDYRITHMVDQNVRDAVASEMKKSLDKADRYLFTHTARLMHKAVFQPGETAFIPFGESVWIEQDESQPFSTLNTAVKAVHVYRIFDIWMLDVISDTTEHIISLMYDDEGKYYEPTPNYRCPYGECQDETKRVEDGGQSFLAPQRKHCPRCEEWAYVWASWVHTAIEMLQKKYAVSSDPKPFSTRNFSHTEKRLVPRHHGKGKPKEKNITVDTPYTVIQYDVSVASALPEKDSLPSEEKGENWLTLASKEDVIYKQKYIPDTERRYRGEWYHSLKERCLREGTATADGKEYRIEVNEQGETVVVGKVVQHSKYVPMLKADVRKKPVTRKVTAKKFEEKEQ